MVELFSKTDHFVWMDLPKNGFVVWKQRIQRSHQALVYLDIFIMAVFLLMKSKHFIFYFLRLSFEQVNAAHQKFYTLKSEMYQLSLFLNTSQKWAVKSCMQKSEGLVQSRHFTQLTAISGASAELGNKAVVEIVVSL